MSASYNPWGMTQGQVLDWASVGMRLDAASKKPIPTVLHCPVCCTQHIDKAEPSMLAGDAAMHGGDWPGRWTNPPHRSHLCHHCGHIWRPADVATVGVEKIETKGKNDSPLASTVQQGDSPEVAQGMQILDEAFNSANRKG